MRVARRAAGRGRAARAACRAGPHTQANQLARRAAGRVMAVSVYTWPGNRPPGEEKVRSGRRSGDWNTTPSYSGAGQPPDRPNRFHTPRHAPVFSRLITVWLQ